MRGHIFHKSLPGMITILCIQALEALNKKDLTEIKSYTKPPDLVEMVMRAVMILRNSEPSWQEAKRQLGESLFL